MKRSARVSLSTLVIVLLLLMVPAVYGQTVSGGFSTTTEAGDSKFEFNAEVYAPGTASGEILYSGPLSIPEQDVDGDGSGDVVKDRTLSLRVSVECGRIEKNRATISGRVRESNVGDYVGRSILLTVEDSSDEKTADAFAWGQYRPTPQTWVPSDNELKPDPGVGMTWYATDSEREDDKGIPAGGAPEAVPDCSSFPFGSFELEALQRGSGDIQVKP